MEEITGVSSQFVFFKLNKQKKSNFIFQNSFSSSKLITDAYMKPDIHLLDYYKLIILFRQCIHEKSSLKMDDLTTDQARPRKRVSFSHKFHVRSTLLEPVSTSFFI